MKMGLSFSPVAQAELAKQVHASSKAKVHKLAACFGDVWGASVVVHGTGEKLCSAGRSCSIPAKHQHRQGTDESNQVTLVPVV